MHTLRQKFPSRAGRQPTKTVLLRPRENTIINLSCPKGSQTEPPLRPRPRGCHQEADEILAQQPPLPRAGLNHQFLQHTSAALTINENADPDVRSDMASVHDSLLRDRDPKYAHTLAGADDMPAHAKSTLAGVSLTIPITAGRLNLGLWQGVYLCEFRNHGGARRIVATVVG